ncbi:MAG: PTS transporter subunit EIIB [Oscillospiraceae bacterium]|nr:PTS transporter subunit EIIB [Oscillospiraceae bacterium]
MAVDNKKIAEEVLAAVGGKDNVSTVTHCATRLRFNLKDAGIPKEDEVKRISGVIGVMQAGGQYQIIIGQNVDKVYEYVCALGNFKREKTVDEVLDQGLLDQKWTVKRVVNNVLNYIVSSMTPVINILMGVALWNVVGTLLSQFNVVPADHPLVTTCTMIFNALMYYIPIYIGYGAAKSLKISNPVWGMVIGGLSIVPTFVNMAATTDTFQLFGFLSVPVADYGQSVIPVLLGVFVFKYLYDFLKKIIPDVISSITISFVSFFVMAILMFWAFCPIGTVFGNVISDVFLALSTSIWPVRVLASMVLSGCWTLVTLCGMHLPIAFATFAIIAQNGSDPFSIACMCAGLFVLNGMSIGAIFKFKKPENRGMAVSSAIAANIGGICEPALYGIGMRNSSTILVMVGGGALAGLLAGIIQPICYNIFAGASIFNILTPWAGASAANMVKGAILFAASMLIGFFGTLFFAKMDEE